MLHIQALRDEYLSAALDGDRRRVTVAVSDSLEQGAGVADVYLKVLTWAQERIGDLWLDGRITPVHEHRATHLTLEQMERLARSVEPRVQLGVRAVVASSEGNLHLVGARAVADFLIMDGWSVDFLGANTPTDDLAAFVDERRVDLVAISVAMRDQLDAAKRCISLLKSLENPPMVIIGGAAIAGDTREASALGADGTAPDALSAVRLARRLVGLEEHEAMLDGYLSSLGERVQVLRKRSGWSQSQLAALSGLDRAYISSAEHGKQNLTLGAIMKLATAFGVTLETMLTGRGMDNMGG